MSQTVVGVFRSNADARRARDELVAGGFAESDVTVQANPADAANSSTSTSTSASNEDEGFMTRVADFFGNLFGDDAASDGGDYSEAVRRGSAVVVVQVPTGTSTEEAQRALAAAGAMNIDAMSESWRKEGYSSFDVTAKPYNVEQITAERGKVLPVVQEELEIGKREVDLGTVRVYSRTVETPVNEAIQLRSQRAEIERRPVNRPATQEDLQAFQGGSIEVRETTERAVVSKTAHVVEEVVVGTATSTEQQTVDDTVRSTVVEVDQGKPASTAGTAGMTGTTSTAGAVSSEDRLFRDHFDTHYASSGASYDTYAPAYTFGSGLRSDQRYANRNWQDVESDVQRDWQTRHPTTTWEKVKSAVQHGWDSVTR
jgi:uncharacterized protein (TIGR02271 family)